MQVRILPPLPISPDSSVGFDRLYEHQYRAYVYLLGIYLGDGCLAWTGRTFRLLIYLNVSQVDVIRECVDAVTIVVPERRAGLVRHGAACLVVSSYARVWRELFPQHGPGRKHTRRIELAPWQRGLAGHYPDAFVRGLIQSDGCRHRRIVNGTDYPAYSFSNRSEDILGLFTWGCDLLGVRWRRASRTTISIARRRDVAFLDDVMGVSDV